ncbi:hypothetical protein BCT04_13835 [Vibrio breoganii]|uniref:hypothetical protein n=1 Tax=Vibrio breoganii TaxID=553239 RepID=UPI000C82DD8F|nr:hypothetical protein [Vibrio breoganii]PMO64394.1 hypothetical protein BCT04_13835 [Vibrio breoganii]
MKITKTAIAVAISSAFLFGCDFDVGSENNATGGTGGGTGGGGLPPVENAQNYVQIQDSSTTDVGLLRVKTSEQKSEIAVDAIPVGYLTVDLTYQDNKAINDGEDKSAYVQVHTDGTGNAELRAEISFSNGSIKSRDTSGSQTDVIGTYTVGEELKVKVSWTETEYTLTVDGQDLGTFAARNTKPVQYISLKVGDKDTKSNYELIADNLEIYNTTDAGDELVFEDDFDHYGVGDDLTDSRYNSALETIVFGTGSDNGGDNGGDGVSELNALIESASPGDIIDLSPDADFSTGVIALNKAVTLDGYQGATITGSACIQITAAGAAVKNLAFENNAIGAECGAHDSDSRRGAITVEEDASDVDNPVVLTNLSFDGSNVTEDGLYKKASWVFSSGHVTLEDSEFINLQSSLQNNAFYTSCVSASRKGIEINNNTFQIDDLGDKETAAVKVGNSSGGTQSSENCNVTVSGNTFTGYTQNVSDIAGSGTDRIVAVFATDAAVGNENGDVETNNTFN